MAAAIAPLLPALIGAGATIGTALISSNAQKSIANKQMQAQQSVPAPQAMQAPVQSAQAPNTPGGAVLVGNQPGSNAAPKDDGQKSAPYASAQTLSTAPALSGTGSGFNGSSLLQQPQLGAGLGQTGVA